jgi:serine/threonine protein kinase
MLRCPRATLLFEHPDGRTPAEAFSVHDGRSTIFQTLVPGLTQPIAVKIADTESLRDEARVLRRLRVSRCEHVTRLYIRYAVEVIVRGAPMHGEEETEASFSGLVLQYCAASLEHALSSPFSPMSIVHVIRQVVQGLAEVHAAGVAHGRLTADHVLFTVDRFRAQLSGFSKAIMTEEVETPPILTSVLPTSIPWECLAPEVAERLALREASGELPDEYDAAAADVWAVGILLFRMLAGGALPFDDRGRETWHDFRMEPARMALERGDSEEFWAIQMRRGVIPPSFAGHSLRSEIARWIDVLLQWDPALRPTAPQMLEHPLISAEPIEDETLVETIADVRALVESRVAKSRERFTTGVRLASDGGFVSAVPDPKLIPPHPATLGFLSDLMTTTGTFVNVTIKLRDVASRLGLQLTTDDTLPIVTLRRVRAGDITSVRFSWHLRRVRVPGGDWSLLVARALEGSVHNAEQLAREILVVLRERE